MNSTSYVSSSPPTRGMAKTPLNRLLAIAAGEGVDTQVLLQGVAVDPNLLWIKGNRINRAQYLSISNTLVNTLDIPDLGFRSGKSFNLGDLGVLGHTILSSENTVQALDTYLSFRQAFGSTFEIHRLPFKDRIVLSAELGILGASDALKRYLTENWLLTLTSLSDLVIEPGSLFSGICLPYAEPVYSERLHQQFNCEIYFNQPQTLVIFNSELCRERLKYACDNVHDFCKRECLKALRSMARPQSQDRTVKALLLDSPERFPTPAELASGMNISERTFRRRLSNLGTSYNKLLLEARMELAASYQTAGDRPIKDIAMSLGYADVASYHRAFKAYHGTTPGQFTQRLDRI